MIRRAATYLVSAVIGIVLGGASALYMAGLWPGMKPLDFGDVQVDGWRSDYAIGSEAADIYTRARVARHGLLGLAKSEAVYFTRTRDDDGQVLRESCDYRLSGGDMPAEWWSITLYDPESMLPMNEDSALSYDKSRAGSGRWEAIISPQAPESEGWISSRNAGTFDLTLRLYVPEAALLDTPETALSPPAVELLQCAGEGA